ncbi:translation initiation factor eIF4E [Sugiyamaella lignohabitans]|uniref:Translation initiation factor eIF4E n=1 Tax=Sugiyamaella lignohabitans TaxID=796027 RepID=A0A167F278_9ASCO|nr:translation initiation factor eIF4E [Sugiyamaella lignohabitans]ANB14731.1 translation initiation factor eIF4E [Sugiyamaella lignohabitans]
MIDRIHAGTCKGPPASGGWGSAPDPVAPASQEIAGTVDESTRAKREEQPGSGAEPQPPEAEPGLANVMWLSGTGEKSTYLAAAGVKKQGANESLLLQGNDSSLSREGDETESNGSGNSHRNSGQVYGLGQGHIHSHGNGHGPNHGHNNSNGHSSSNGGHNHNNHHSQNQSLSDELPVDDEINEEGLRVVKPRLGSHILPASWTFWFLHRGPGQNFSNYLDATRQIGSFDTVEEFWDIYSHLRRIDKLPFTSEYQLFRKGVKPLWEDEVNVNGGKWVIRLERPKERRRDDGAAAGEGSVASAGVIGSGPTGTTASASGTGVAPIGAPSSSGADSTQNSVAATRAFVHKQVQARHKAALSWENLILAIVGNTIGSVDDKKAADNDQKRETTNEDEEVDDNEDLSELLGDEIVGAVVSVRRDEDILSVWNRSGNDKKVVNKIKVALQRTLNLSDDVYLEYKVHTKSIKEGAKKQATYDQLKQQQHQQQTPTGGSPSHYPNKNGHHEHRHFNNNNNNNNNNNSNYHQSHNGNYHHNHSHHNNHSTGFHGPVGKTVDSSASASTTSVDL